MSGLLQRRLVATIVVVSCCVALTVARAGDVDLEVLSVKFQQESNLWYATATYNIKTSEGVTDFAYVVTWRQYRNNELIRTVASSEVSVVPMGTCIACVFACDSSCESIVDGVSRRGKCKKNGSDPCVFNTKTCVCNVSTQDGLDVTSWDIAPGDVVSFQLSIGAGQSEPDTSNNEASATF